MRSKNVIREFGEVVIGDIYATNQRSLNSLICLSIFVCLMPLQHRQDICH